MKPEDFSFMGDEFVGALKYHDGVRRVIEICVSIHGFNWKEFQNIVAKNKNQMAFQTDFTRFMEILKKIDGLTELVGQMDERGHQIQREKEKANLN